MTKRQNGFEMAVWHYVSDKKQLVDFDDLSSGEKEDVCHCYYRSMLSDDDCAEALYESPALEILVSLLKLDFQQDTGVVIALIEQAKQAVYEHLDGETRKAFEVEGNYVQGYRPDIN